MTAADGRVSRAHGTGNDSGFVRAVRAVLVGRQEERNLAETEKINNI